MMIKIRNFSLLLLIAGFFLYASCNRNLLNIDPSAKLTFSSDTVMFDTVFTEIGSTTQQLIVKNTASDGIANINRLFLAMGSNSNFRLNVNGITDDVIEDLEILPGDSIFIFVEVTVDPNGANTPMVINDSIVFEMGNDLIQDVNLVAFGQDYHLINGEWIPTSTWINDKPYLIYNSMGIDSGEVLTIEKGCQLHFHYLSSLYVLGSLQVKGSVDEPVVFQGDRLEHRFDQTPGQWGYIYFLSGSSDNVIDNAIIKNSIIGMRVDSFPEVGQSLILRNTIVKNNTAVGLYALGAKILAENCVFTNAGQYALALTLGGHYGFYHCSVGNSYTHGTRVTPSVLLNNWYEDIYGVINIRAIENAYFANCIIDGNKDDEIGFDVYPGTEHLFNYYFDHCLVTISEENEYNPDRFIDCIFNEDPAFVDLLDRNLELDTLSAAKDMGDATTASLIPTDILGNSRTSDNGPDIGAYERIE